MILWRKLYLKWKMHTCSMFKNRKFYSFAIQKLDDSNCKNVGFSFLFLIDFIPLKLFLQTHQFNVKWIEIHQFNIEVCVVKLKYKVGLRRRQHTKTKIFLTIYKCMHIWHTLSRNNIFQKLIDLKVPLTTFHPSKRFPFSVKR